MAFDPVSAALDIGGKIIDRIWPNPEEKDKAKLELLKLAQAGELAELTASVQQMQAVNETMQEEAKSASWMQRSWRPVCGFTLAGMIVNNYILLPYFGAFGIRPIEIPEVVWQTLLAVVGVSALTRGLSQITEAWKQAKGAK